MSDNNDWLANWPGKTQGQNVFYGNSGLGAMTPLPDFMGSDRDGLDTIPDFMTGESPHPNFMEAATESYEADDLYKIYQGMPGLNCIAIEHNYRDAQFFKDQECVLPAENIDLLMSIEKWRETSLEERKSVYKKVLIDLNAHDPKKRWKFFGEIDQEKEYDYISECSCNYVAKSKSQGCDKCGSEVEVTMSQEIAVIECMNKECQDVKSHYFNAVIENPCESCNGEQYLLNKDVTKTPIGIYFDNRTGVIFNLIPGNEGLVHGRCGVPATYSEHKYLNSQVLVQPAPISFKARFCEYPDGPCCCPLGTEIIKPFLISQTTITESQALASLPNINGFRSNSLRTVEKKSAPILSISFTQAAGWLDQFDMDLPSVAQWRYACLGGVEGLFPWGTSLNLSECLVQENPLSHQQIIDHRALKSAEEKKTRLAEIFAAVKSLSVTMDELALVESMFHEKIAEISENQSFTRYIPAIKDTDDFSHVNGFAIKDMLGNIRELTNKGTLVGASVFQSGNTITDSLSNFESLQHNSGDIGFRAVFNLDFSEDFDL